MSPESAHALERDLDAFLQLYPRDGHADTVRTYLGWLYFERGERGPARAVVEPVLHGPRGAAADFALAIEAGLWLETGRVAEAYVRLLELKGKLIDAEERVLGLGLLIRATHALKRHRETCRLIFDWLEQAPPHRQERMIVQVGVWVEETPSAELEVALRELNVRPAEEPRARRQARAFLVERIRRELGRTALAQNDARLAQRLLGQTAATGAGDEDRLQAIVEGSDFSARVEGRTLGLVLELGGPEPRRRSAEVATGISTTLSLARRDESTDQVHLAVHDAADDVTKALGELAGEGAAILVAGATPDTASAAARWAEARRVPVLLLVAPGDDPGRRRFSFVVGARVADASAQLVERVRAAAEGPVAVVEPDDPGCDATKTAPGAPRFTTADWQKSRAKALVLLANADCSRAALREAQERGLSLSVALGLEAMALAGPSTATRWVLAAGPFPFLDGQHPEDLDQFRASRGRIPSWYESLGHDVALLATQALRQLPVSTTDDAQRVAQLHDLGRLHLTRGKVPGLWTTEAAGFTPALELAREVSVTSLSKP